MNNPPCDKHAWFITGTDTGCGKTFVTCALLHALRQAGHSAIGMKPVAAGTDADGCNEDVVQLIAASSVKVDRQTLNPYCFTPAIAPHIAAAEAKQPIDLVRIQCAFEELLGKADHVLIEGVGGFCVPLGPAVDTADLAEQLALPVILVVGMRLGCLNHALLTVQAIAHRNLRLAGWIANTIDPEMARPTENLDALRARIAAPLLGITPPRSTPEAAAAKLRLPV